MVSTDFQQLKMDKNFISCARELALKNFQPPTILRGFVGISAMVNIVFCRHLLSDEVFLLSIFYARLFSRQTVLGEKVSPQFWQIKQCAGYKSFLSSLDVPYSSCIFSLQSPSLFPIASFPAHFCMFIFCNLTPISSFPLVRLFAHWTRSWSVDEGNVIRGASPRPPKGMGISAHLVVELQDMDRANPPHFLHSFYTH